MTNKPSQQNPAPIYNRIRDVFAHGFRIDWVTSSFITITHAILFLATPLAYVYAPSGFWKIMLGWTLIHAFVASLSTTVYAHRLIAHGAAKKIRWPVHVLFGWIGQVFAIQGSVRHWAAMHIVHHGVDKTGKHHLDPYSATWFPKAWQNFLWSHVLTFFFFHPDEQAKKIAYESKKDPFIVWQDKLYVPLLILLNFITPLVVGYLVEGVIGALCLMTASIGGFILAQHNTWTVNSVTHMWGVTKGAFSSAKNNYLWMGPLGEGNHHADHHDYARDYRNGFGWSGWALDPTRYVILALRSIGLVEGLQRASKRKEAEIVAKRALLNAQRKSSKPRWTEYETKLESLKTEWLEAVKQWESFKSQKIKLLAELKEKHANAELSTELRQATQRVRGEIERAKLQMQQRKRAFFETLYEMRAGRPVAI